MAKQVQLRRGDASEHETFTGAIGELTYVSDDKTLRIHDGSTAGGINVLAGVGSMNIRQIVESDYAEPSGWGDIYKTINGDSTTYYNMNVSLSITPKVTGSTLLIYFTTRLDFLDDDGSATDVRYGWFGLWLNNVETTTNTEVSGGSLVYERSAGENRPDPDTTGDHAHTAPSILYKHTAGAAGVAMDFDFVLRPHLECENRVYWDAPPAEYGSQFYIIEIA